MPILFEFRGGRESPHLVKYNLTYIIFVCAMIRNKLVGRYFLCQQHIITSYIGRASYKYMLLTQLCPYRYTNTMHQGRPSVTVMFTCPKHKGLTIEL